MKIAICCYSSHHGNTRKVAQAMAREIGAELLDATARQDVCLEDCDCVGLASGIYGFEVHQDAVEFARRYLPAGMPVFFVTTYGGVPGTGARAFSNLAKEKDCPVLGEFSCRGYNTFGPFKLLGGTGKGLPSEEDLDRARAFIRGVAQRLESRG